jgi:predicted TIM-barrel fold metal-dependent hydrolase
MVYYHYRYAMIFLFLLFGAWSVACQNVSRPRPEVKGSQPQTSVKYGVTVEAGPMDSLLLKDYAPDSSLVITQTVLNRARFPVIDVHTHVYANSGQEVADWVKTMDEVGIGVTVILTDVIGAEFDRLADLYLKPYPNRFQLYCGLDTQNIEVQDYPERAAGELVRCYGKGARGVGELSDKGWGFGGTSEIHLPRGQRLQLDDTRLDLFWQKCAELKLPVNVHVADHPSCWKPLGPHQERTPDFQGFNLYGKDVPSYEELLAARDRLLTRHPRTTFIFCHLSNQGNDLASLSKVLDRFPNLFLDISARDYEIGRQPRSAAAFMGRYRNRLLFGTDMGREKHMYQAWWRLLESADEFIPGRIWWRYYGLDLPVPVLESLYQSNAKRILNWQER